MKTLLSSLNLHFKQREGSAASPGRCVGIPPIRASAGSQPLSLRTTRVSCRWLCLPMASFYLAEATDL